VGSAGLEPPQRDSAAAERTVFINGRFADNSFGVAERSHGEALVEPFAKDRVERDCIVTR
jgi:hypothetical protein